MTPTSFKPHLTAIVMPSGRLHWRCTNGKQLGFAVDNVGDAFRDMERDRPIRAGTFLRRYVK